MGVSLAKEPYVRDARPSADRRAMIGAALLHLQATRTGRDLAASACLVAPALLAMCNLSRDDLESVSPIDWCADPLEQRQRIDRAASALVTTLYAGEACPEDRLRHQVLDLVRPLRTALMDAHSAWWYNDGIAMALADRTWEPRPATRLAAFGTSLSYLVTMMLALISAMVALPLIMSGLTDTRRREALKEAARPRVAPRRAQSLPVASPSRLLAGLQDPSLLTDLDRAWRLLHVHASNGTDDLYDALRVSRELECYAAQFSERCAAGEPNENARRCMTETVRMMIRKMDDMSGTSSPQIVRDLEALDDPALLADLDRARGLTRIHLATVPEDADEVKRVEKHLSELCARFVATVQSGTGLSQHLHDGMVLAVRALIATMESIASRSALQAAQDLETEIRFVVGAHGTVEDALALPAERLAA